MQGIQISAVYNLASQDNPGRNTHTHSLMLRPRARTNAERVFSRRAACTCTQHTHMPNFVHVERNKIIILSVSGHRPATLQPGGSSFPFEPTFNRVVAAERAGSRSAN